jgi:hypothetical protein
MRAWLIAAALVLASLGATGAARAQSDAVLRDARLAAVRDRLTTAVRAARQEGLPADWLLDKVAEGLSKRVPPERIAVAVDTMLGRIRTAEGLVRGVPGAERGAEHRRLLRAATDALTAGAPAEPLGRLVREVAGSDRGGAGQRVHEALTTVAELAEREFGGAAAVDATGAAFRRARSQGVQQLLQDARRLGRDPPGGRDEALRGLGRGSPPGHRGLDRGAGGRDHGRDVQRDRGPR